MAEKLVSPGVFTQEKDLSFLPTGVGQIGAALVGPSTKGPAFRPTVVNSYQEFIDIFGDLDASTYLPYTAKSYLRSAGTATVIRIMGTEQWNGSGSYVLTANSKPVGVLVPTIGNSSGPASLTITNNTITDGTTTITASYNPTSSNYIANLFSTSPLASGSNTITGGWYLYRFAPNAASSSNQPVAGSPTATSDWFINGASYSNAKSPWITSQTAGGTALELFKIGRISDGTIGNYDCKVTIEDIRKAGTVPGSEYATFNLYVRRVGGLLGATDTDQRPEVLETFLNVTMDPYSDNYFLKRIGTMYSTVDADGRVSVIGDYPNKSKYIYIIPAAGLETAPPNLYPFGFKKPKSTFPSSTAPSLLSYVTRQGSADLYDNRVEFGFNFFDADSKQLLYSIPDAAVNIDAFASDFNLDDMFSHASSSAAGLNGTTFAASASLSSSNAPTEMLKFAIPLQGGHDGMPYNRAKNTGADITSANVFGFNCSSGLSSGSLAYIKALNILSNADEYDINMIVTPGIISSLHGSITTKAIQVCENRGDAFYIMDTSEIDNSVSLAIANVSTFDTNYAATYYPWVKVQDSVSKKLVWVPPSVVVPGVIAQNDRLSYEWFAPAGLNRGGIPEATQVYYRLTQADRDNLYLNRINPIASFPTQGICVWGQKTLQAKASALDRINVRRLLIATKKYIASATKYLVFEQNNTATRNRFLNIVNPYLESVKANQGLYAFKAVMDENLNTPDLIDRNILYGQIYLQPTRTAEFILIDFNIQATGASFTNA